MDRNYPVDRGETPVRSQSAQAKLAGSAPTRNNAAGDIMERMQTLHDKMSLAWELAMTRADNLTGTRPPEDSAAVMDGTAFSGLAGEIHQNLIRAVNRADDIIEQLRRLETFA